MNIQSRIIHYFILSTIVMVPIFLWFITPTVLPRFDSLQATLASIGELSGIVGTVLFSLTIMLSMRPRILERAFAGINNLYIKHSHLGQIAFIMLLAHPLLLLARYAQNTHDAAHFFYLNNSLQQDLGIVSITLTLLIIILTLYLRPKYQIWKSLHKLLGVSLFLGALHIYLSPSYVLHHNILLTSYVLGFASIAIVLWLYKSVFDKSFTSRYTYTVVQADKLSENIIEIEMTPKQKDSTLPYNPGQFIFIKFLQDGIPTESHPFSIISNTSSDDTLKIAVKVLGDYTDTLYNQLAQWAEAEVEGPYGMFSYAESKKEKQIWIAGGIGITPFISMAKDLLNNRFYNVDLYYAVRNESEAVYLPLLQKLATQLGNLSIIPFYSDSDGFITAEYIAETTQDTLERDILLCAPPAMIHALKQQLIQIGVSENHLHSEEFKI